jgi:uncharacterized membrane protein
LKVASGKWQAAPTETTRKPALKNIREVSRELRWPEPVWLLVLAGMVYLSAIAIAGYRSMGVGVDLPIFEQSMWNSLRGRWFYNTIEGGNHFGVHLSPVLLLLLPVYALVPRPETLLVCQSLGLSAGMVPVYWMARDRLNERSLGLILGAAYLLGPAVGFVNFDEFHAVPFAVPAFAFAFYYLWQRKFKHFAVAFVVALSCKEDAALVGVMLGLYGLIVLREKAVGLATMLFSAAWFVLAVLVIVPHFAGHPYAPAGGGFSYLGGDIVSIIATLIGRPGIAIAEVTRAAKLEYVYWLLYPVAFLPLLAPEVFLIAAPALLQNLLSRYIWNYVVFRRYVSIPIPFLYLATIFALERAGRLFRLPQWDVKRQGRARTWASHGLSLLILGLSVRASLELSRLPPRWLPKITDRAQFAERIHRIIPPDASVAANDDHLSRLARREGLYRLTQWPQADYVLVDLKSAWSDLTGEERQGLVAILEANPDYQRVSSWDLMFLYVRSECLEADADHYVAALGDPAQPLWKWSFGNQARLLRAELAKDRYRPGEHVDLYLYWQALEPMSANYNVFVHLIGPDEQLVAQDDKAPQGEARPTGAWLVDEIVPDRFRMLLPPDAPTGTYRINVGLYQWQTGARLSVLDESGAPLGDFVSVATLDVR